MASSIEKIVDYHAARLRDRRPEVRLESIAELQTLGAAAAPALEALRICCETAEEEEVREAARQAGYVIFMAAKKSSGS